MKEWTTEERYRELDRSALGELEELHNQVKQSPFRCDYHVQTVTGLLGDTNGFSWFNGRWHLFYQWFPYGPVHGLKHWYHTSSPDLLHWRNEGVALIPSGYMDNKGDFSGSGYAEGDTLYLPYTGNHRDEDWTRTPYQLLATMDKDGNFTKQEEMLYGPVEGYSEHQRDPKLFYRKEDGYYYFLLGAQTEGKKGKFLLFRSEEIRKGWKCLGELKVRGYDDFGFMVECPDLERVGDQWLLLFSPQGLAPQKDEFRNIYQNVYLIGDMDFENLEFIPQGPYKELDRGFDFYAAQCAGQSIWPDKAVMCAWFGVSDYSYPPTIEEGYSGLQTMPRILTIENGCLKQRPPETMKELRKGILFEKKDGSVLKDELKGKMPSACVIETKHTGEKMSLSLFAEGEGKGFCVSYDGNKLTADRSAMFHQLNTEYGTDRSVVLPDGLKDLQIFIDHSCAEIFVNDGDYVLSARLFPVAKEDGFAFEGIDDITVYETGRAVEDDFVIFSDQKTQD